jgi:hypothetical protein
MVYFAAAAALGRVTEPFRSRERGQLFVTGIGDWSLQLEEREYKS